MKKPIMQMQFDNLYLINNENLENVCLSESRIPAIELITAGLIKFEENNLSKKQVMAIINKLMKGIAFTDEEINTIGKM